MWCSLSSAFSAAASLKLSIKSSLLSSRWRLSLFGVVECDDAADEEDDQVQEIKNVKPSTFTFSCTVDDIEIVQIEQYLTIFYSLNCCTIFCNDFFCQRGRKWSSPLHQITYQVRNEIKNKKCSAVGAHINIKIILITTIMISYHVFQIGILLNIGLRWRWQQLDPVRYIL